ncbi:hypothetical protein O1611_g2111 [Lasiodiplodia mahajangana]|uniref:Uncharacterized protein n=1 Tax=Lasiodiplodia mahajangana TaxID=1108764 RepID=A0ACC2JWC8_9PEZI|nr:hypothetical protein O1611_g2111 [Lasiodiplodia mahajangana]
MRPHTPSADLKLILFSDTGPESHVIKMGLLNFLSKKSYSDLTQRDTLKTSAYDTTVALSPPIRGTYPVLGNGNKILEQFQKSHPNLATVPQSSTPAPSPLVPRVRGDDLRNRGEERPRTAPSSQAGETTGTSSLRSQPRSGLPAPPKKKYGPYKLPSKIATNVQASSLSAKPAPSPGLLSTYSDSIRSGESTRTKGYVDLLDAQSMIKPSDFYGRVQATGARNYGEDVADRNIDDRSATPNITTVQEPASSHLDTKWTSAVSKYVDDDSADELSKGPRIRHSMSSGLRSKHTSPDPFPKRTSSRLPPRDADDMFKAMTRTGSARSERAARRKSMPSSVAPAYIETRRSSSAVRRGKEKDSDLFPDSLRDRALAVTAHEREYTRPNISSKRQSLIPPQAEQQLRQKRNDVDKPLPALPPTAKDQSRRKSVSHNALLESRLLKRQSLQGIRSGSRGEIYEDTYQQKISLQGAQAPRGRNPTRRQLGSTTDLQDSFYNALAGLPDQASQITSPDKCADNEGELDQLAHFRKPSFIPPSNTSIILHEAETPVPERNSSLRRWSLTSETVDLSPMFPRAQSHREIPPVPDLPFLKPTARDTSVMSSRTCSLPAAPEPQSDEFYLEDYVSNDSSPTPSRGSYEKDLLFSETGYGLPGTQMSGLPGLFDTTVLSPSPDLSTSRALEPEFRSMSALLHLPAYSGSDSDHSFQSPEQTDSSDDDMNFDIPMSRAGSALRSSWVQERPPATKQPIEEVSEDYDSSDY